MAENLPILKIPLAFYGIKQKDGRIIKDDVALARLNDYITRLTAELARQIGEQVNKAPNRPAAPLTKDLLDAIRTMPIVMLRLGDDYEIPPVCMQILYEHMYLVYEAYRQIPPQLNRQDPVAQGKEAQRGELLKVLKGFPEYIYHILDTGIQELPVGEEAVSLQTELGKAPYWAIRWAVKHPESGTLDGVRNLLGQYQFSDAAAAHCVHWLRTHDKPREEQLGALEEPSSEGVSATDIIGNDVPLSISVARKYPEMNVEKLLVSVLGKNPMWVYNWLRLVDRGPIAELKQQLIQSPPWAIQYIADVNPPDKDEMLEQISRRPKNDWWEEWIELHSKSV